MKRKIRTSDMNNKIVNSNKKRIFNLSERTLQFSNDIIKCMKILPVTVINRPLIVQLVRSATSVGANYSEADEAESKKDFIHKMKICKKEIKETKYWIQVISNANEQMKNELEELYQEAQELNLIFSKIINSSNQN